MAVYNYKTLENIAFIKIIASLMNNILDNKIIKL